jgi:hypothetical protein
MQAHASGSDRQTTEAVKTASNLLNSLHLQKLSKDWISLIYWDSALPNLSMLQRALIDWISLIRQYRQPAERKSANDEKSQSTSQWNLMTKACKNIESKKSEYCEQRKRSLVEPRRRTLKGLYMSTLFLRNSDCPNSRRSTFLRIPHWTLIHLTYKK